MRHQLLRPAPTVAEMATMYPTPHDHRIYGRGHYERVEATIALACRFIEPNALVADLSCGNGEIARRLAPQGVVIFGDYAAGYDIVGPIEDTLFGVRDIGAWILSETLEHVADPAKLLGHIRDRADQLVLSTPLKAWDDANPEHLHAWDREHVEHLLDDAGWFVEAFDSVDSRVYDEPYLYGLWVCQ